MNSEKLLVLGSNSFSGANLVNRALELGYEVMGISRSEEPQSVFLPYKWQDNEIDIVPIKALFSDN